VTHDAEILETRLGANQRGLRERNERLVLTLLRHQPGLAKAQIARRTGLSAQTVSRLIGSLEADGLVLRGEPQRGRVGQPSTPLNLNPDGAIFLGLKVGRRSVELIAVDFLGRILERENRVHDYPSFDAVLGFVTTAVTDMATRLGPQRQARVAGLGIAMPFHLWGWAKRIGVSPELMADWQTRDFKLELSQRLSLPIYLQNDASSTCSAELVFGTGTQPANFANFYVAFFIGGGLVLRGSLFTGATGNAAGFGPLLVPDLNGQSRPLIDLASLATLETRLIEQGHDGRQIWDQTNEWSIPEEILSPWLEEAGHALAEAARATQSVLDVESVLIDGWLPPALRSRLTERVNAYFDSLDLTGITRPVIREGSIGPDARALGAASLPLSARFLVDLPG